MKDKIRFCFNKAASSYDQSSHLQEQIGIDLIKLLKNYNKSFNSIIDLGCGTGKVTLHLAEQLSYTNFQAIDFSEDLLNIAINRFKALDINCSLADFDNKLTSKYDLIFSNMALQWSSNLEQLFASLYYNLNQIFAFSIPLLGSLEELPKRNNFYTNSEIITYLEKSGFKILRNNIEVIKIDYASKLEALKSIKSIGANQITHNNNINSLSKSKLNQKSSLTYNIGFFIARK